MARKIKKQTEVSYGLKLAGKTYGITKKTKEESTEVVDHPKRKEGPNSITTEKDDFSKGS